MCGIFTHNLNFYFYLHVTPKFSQIATNVKCFSSLYHVQFISGALQFLSQYLLTEALRSWI